MGRVNSRYESGVHFPAATAIRPLAEALSVPPGYLVTEDDRQAELLLDLQRLDLPQLAQVEGLIQELLNPDE